MHILWNLGVIFNGAPGEHLARPIDTFPRHVPWERGSGEEREREREEQETISDGKEHSLFLGQLPALSVMVCISIWDLNSRPCEELLMFEIYKPRPSMLLRH